MGVAERTPDDRPPTDPAGAGAEGRRPRRVVFPYVWIGGLIALRLVLQTLDVTVDFKTMGTLASVLLGVFGLAFWYGLRGRGPAVVRLAVAVAPFLAMYAFFSVYELRHRGDGSIEEVVRRGAPRPDQRLAAVETAAPDTGLADWAAGPYDYPRFLGSGPWAEAAGPALATDWDANPPEELWRREVGAGWSSFAIVGPYAVTQEQRGDQELVVCYDTRTGEAAWSHADLVRFDPEDAFGQMGRTGPRATPTVAAGGVYAQGATGIVTRLDARTGELSWRIDTTERYGVAVPVWGKSGSPLFVPAASYAADLGTDAPDLVIVNVGVPAGAETADYNASLVAFDAATGDEVWADGDRQTSYASPQFAELLGQTVVLQTCDDLLVGRRVADGTRLFAHPWTGQSNNRPSCSQPIVLSGDRLLISKGYGHGASLLSVGASPADGADALWELTPVWSPPLRPVLQTKFSNTVVRGGRAFALNGTVLQCVEIESGRIVWKKRRRPSFGFGQVLLAGEHLLVLTEAGEVVLADATSDRYREHAALQALDPEEVCWNTPALAGDLLLVRNGVEAAAYRLPVADNGDAAAPLADETAAKSGTATDAPTPGA